MAEFRRTVAPGPFSSHGTGRIVDADSMMAEVTLTVQSLDRFRISRTVHRTACWAVADHLCPLN